MVQPVRLLAAGLAAVALAGSAVAQPPAPRTVTTTTTTTTGVRKASVVMNSNVVVDGGTTVGKITDFVISEGGCIDYVVVDADGQFVLVPYSVVRLDSDRRVVQVNVTREKFREIPTFTGTNWPVTDQQYIGKVRTVFGVTESGYRGDRRDNDRQPLDRRNDRRDQPTPPQQRRNVENPKPPSTNPPAPRPVDPNRNPPVPPERDRPRVPPPPPPPPPGTDRPPA